LLETLHIPCNVTITIVD